MFPAYFANPDAVVSVNRKLGQARHDRHGEQSTEEIRDDDAGPASAMVAPEAR